MQKMPEQRCTGKEPENHNKSLQLCCGFGSWPFCLDMTAIVSLFTVSGYTLLQPTKCAMFCRAAASRLAGNQEEIAAVPAQPSSRTTGDSSSSRRTTGDTNKAAHFLLKNPNASRSMLRRSPSSQRTADSAVDGNAANPTSPTQGEAGASPFEYSQGGFSNDPILGGEESPTRNPLNSIPDRPLSPFGNQHMQSLVSGSSGELSTSSSRALLGNPRGSS